MGCPLVSIIIPIYNVSDYVDTCIESACRQTYKNLEIILVDDGSPDDCPQKCDAWAIKDNRIKVIHKKNGGLSDARNAGLDIATGKYIYFLDGDDSIKNNLVETVVKHMEDGADMVAFDFARVFNDGTSQDCQYHELGLYNTPDEYSRAEFIVEKLAIGKIGWEAWSRIYRREKIEKYQLRFADNRKIFAEDLYFCLCYCTHADKIISIPDVLYNYVVRTDSIMGMQKNVLNIGRMNELSKAFLAFLKKWKDCNWLIRNYSVVHLLIINPLKDMALKLLKTESQVEIRKSVLADIQDIGFFNFQIRSVFKKVALLEKIYTGFYLAEMLSFYRFLVDGSYLKFRLRNKILYKFKFFIDDNFGRRKKRIQEYRRVLSSRNAVVVIGTEDLGNIGDHQIAVSMIDFIKDIYNADRVIEVSARKYSDEKDLIVKYIKNHHSIVLPGGGNFGNIYQVGQHIREDVIQDFPDNKKIIFPQTIHYTNDTEGKKSIERDQQLYVKDNNIYLFTRDDVSLDFAKENFSCDVFFAPDIVLSKKYEGNNTSLAENKVLLCLRSDLEGKVSPKVHALIDKLINDNGFSSVCFDTQKDYHISLEDRDTVVKSTLDLWDSSKLVITDRLHGLIFSAITGTPCIALGNFNHKVKGTYEYIKYLPYIRFAENSEEIEKAFNELTEMGKCEYDSSPLLPYFEKLREILKEK